MTVKKLRRFAVAGLFLLVVCAWMPVNTSAQGGNYSFMNIDYPGADFTSVGGINDSAAVVGYYFGGDGVVHGFLYNGTAYSDLDYPGSSATGAAGINNSGVITGYHDDAGGTHGFLDNQGSFSSFDCPGTGVGGTNPHGINNNGVVVGVCYQQSGIGGFIDTNGVFSFINYPGGCSTIAFGINDSGQIAGTYRDGCSGNTHGFVYSNGAFTAIDYPGASQTFALGINNAGVVVGYSDLTAFPYEVGFLWQAGQFTTINSDATPEPSGINNGGAIVGLYLPGGFEHGFLGTPSSSPQLQLVPVLPCRLVDTRPQNGGSGPILGGTFQSFPIPQEGNCNIPTTAAAYSLNVSVVPSGPLGYLTVWPTGESRPGVATLNSLDGRIKANAAIVPAGTNGAISVYATNTTNVILDINGYFAPASPPSTFAFYPLTPCRVADTRKANFPSGLGAPYLPGQQERDFPILNATSCNIPSSAIAYSLNFSVVPHGPLGYMTVWPTGLPRPLVSTLNDIPGQIIANAAIVVAGTTGDVSVYPSSDTDLVIDINGYFALPGTGGLSLYTLTPCRVIDTRKIGNGQPFSGNLTPPVDVTASPCGVPGAAQAYVLNATVVPTGALGYLTLWPDGEPKPLVSTLNALDGSITNNMAIVPSTNGKVDAYASGITQLSLDISSYFAP